MNCFLAKNGNVFKACNSVCATVWCVFDMRMPSLQNVAIPTLCSLFITDTAAVYLLLFKCCQVSRVLGCNG